ncbi:DUF72 domain-containing protein [Myxococcus sp. K15C18031901]|uniref:DUF72 domain-containing protein n=1 Tax=Myxococcus dinghuensis TaxID=2906761 RepID=UPI0020A757D9|nr:DUF72 domain-containing protein [Myxococcus dinghuensis]MCP3100846.1 DUF72 domain-containing protein [Myxococcus dinghuensis]
MGTVHLGTSGYVYRDWKGRFYPPDLPARRWLSWYARVFTTVELNATFYRLPTPEAVDRWRDAVPPGFRFACKGSRFLTHLKRLTDVEDGLEHFYAPVRRLGRKLGPILWQLPPFLSGPDPERLDRFLAHQPRGIQQVVEFRDTAWYHPEVLAVLDAHHAALCEHDLLARRPPRPTGRMRYLRFHGTQARYAGGYGKAALRRVAGDLRTWREHGHTAWVFFNNDLRGHAVLDALVLSELLGHPTRLPPDMERPPAEPRSGTARRPSSRRAATSPHA